MSGVISEVGPSVDYMKVGAPVYVFTDSRLDGTAAEYKLTVAVGPYRK